jgi:mRNA interferase RelE/StbE
MEIILTRNFQKEVRALSAPLKVRVLAIFERVVEAETLADIPNIKIMEGAHNYFRIRLGDYRIGFISVQIMSSNSKELVHAGISIIVFRKINSLY